MEVLMHSDIFEICNNFKYIFEKIYIFDIVYNSKNKLCFTKKYIELLEEFVFNKDVFNNLIIELSDSDRITIENTEPQNDLREEFVEISKKSKNASLTVLAFRDNTNLLVDIPFLTISNSAAPTNKHWIIIELLSKNFISVSYQHFKNDIEITDFFKNLFSLTRYIKEICIFDREKTAILIETLKGSKIKYYTLLGKGRHCELERIETKNELKTKLGGRLKLFYTPNPRDIHERKIICDDLIITIDNSRNNLTITERTWEITVTCDEQKGNIWKQKCIKFTEELN